MEKNIEYKLPISSIDGMEIIPMVTKTKKYSDIQHQVPLRVGVYLVVHFDEIVIPSLTFVIKNIEESL